MLKQYDDDMFSVETCLTGSSHLSLFGKLKYCISRLLESIWAMYLDAFIIWSQFILRIFIGPFPPQLFRSYQTGRFFKLISDRSALLPTEQMKKLRQFCDKPQASWWVRERVGIKFPLYAQAKAPCVTLKLNFWRLGTPCYFNIC